MTQTGGVLAALALAVLAAAGCSAGSRRPATFAQAAREKADVTIVVTDSGLGGLSVVADLASRLPASGIVRSARIVFVNALLDDAIGYNDLRDEADKVRVFDAALEAMERRYRPDLILVACNTLSVFYERTLHAKRGTTETVSIVPMGVDLVERALREKPEARAVLFATKGTIDSGAHRRLLEQRGIAADRVVGQACPRLTGAIERGAHDAATASRIEGFVKEAVGRLGERSGPVVASLNCTHFGYARPLWERSFEALGYGDVTVLDPNPLMTDHVLRTGGERRYPETAVTVEVVSKTPIGEDVKGPLGALLRTVSPATADALARSSHVPDLFHVEIDPAAILR
ncbi:MAG: aspartate/glutamate racemase family protein [Thermoanaerobaculia bacterium]